jgi:hypothetical protein
MNEEVVKGIDQMEEGIFQWGPLALKIQNLDEDQSLWTMLFYFTNPRILNTTRKHGVYFNNPIHYRALNVN